MCYQRALLSGQLTYFLVYALMADFFLLLNLLRTKAYAHVYALMADFCSPQPSLDHGIPRA